MQRNSFNGNDKTSGVNIKVIVRCRPPNEKERADPGHEDIVKIRNNEVIVTLNKSGEVYEKKYGFDYVCDAQVTQEELFSNYVYQIVDEVLEGFNCTLFCYGQTGTGKTYTMEGKLQDILKLHESSHGPSNHKKPDAQENAQSDISSYYEICENEDTGLIFRVTRRIFDYLNQKRAEALEKHRSAAALLGSMADEEPRRAEPPETDESSADAKSESTFAGVEQEVYSYSIKVSYLEIYNEELCDLLNTQNEGSKLRIYEDISSKNRGLNVDKLEEKSVQSFEDVYYTICSAIRRRRTAETSFNKKSSRSHSIFTIFLTMRFLNSEGEGVIKIGKLNLVDLAGSENAIKNSVGNVRIRQQESCNINQSLLTLGRVINALVENNSYIPYRDSKLTRLLQDSLGGKTKTFIIATISPSSLCVDETIGTLDYAFRAKNIKNKPEINVKTNKKDRIKELRSEVQKLKNKLIMTQEKNGIYMDTSEYKTLQDSMQAHRNIISEKDKLIGEQTKQIQSLTSQVDQTEDIKSRLCSFLPHAITKLKDIQKFHDVMINEMILEKSVSSFVASKWKLSNDRLIRQEEEQVRTRQTFSSRMEAMKKLVQNQMMSVSNFGTFFYQILNQTKEKIHRANAVMTESKLKFHNILNELFFKLKEFLNTLIDNMDISRIHDENYKCSIDRMKCKILKCRMEVESGSAFCVDRLRRRRGDPEGATAEGATAEDGRGSRRSRSEAHLQMLNILRDMPWDDQGKRSLTQIKDFVMEEERRGGGDEPADAVPPMRYLLSLYGMFHTIYKAHFNNVKTDIRDKIETLGAGNAELLHVVELVKEAVQKTEQHLLTMNEDKIEKVKVEIQEDIQQFQKNTMRDIQSVLERNVKEINERINRKLKELPGEIEVEFLKGSEDRCAGAAKTVETALGDMKKKHLEQFEHVYHMNEKVQGHIIKIHSLLKEILVDLNEEVSEEDANLKRNLNRLMLRINQRAEKWNSEMEIVAEEVEAEARQNLNEKGELYQRISDKVLTENSELKEEEEKIQHWFSRTVTEGKSCHEELNQRMSDIERCVEKFVHSFGNSDVGGVDEKGGEKGGENGDEGDSENRTSIRSSLAIEQQLNVLTSRLRRKLYSKETGSATDPSVDSAADPSTNPGSDTNEDNIEEALRNSEIIKSQIQKELGGLCKELNIEYDLLVDTSNEPASDLNEMYEELKTESGWGHRAEPSEEDTSLNMSNCHLSVSKNVENISKMQISINSKNVTMAQLSPRRNLNQGSQENATSEEVAKSTRIAKQNMYSNGAVYNQMNGSESRSPVNKMRTFDLNNSKKGSPNNKRIKEEDMKNRKMKFPRKSKN